MSTLEHANQQLGELKTRMQNGDTISMAEVLTLSGEIQDMLGYEHQFDSLRHYVLRGCRGAR